MSERATLRLTPTERASIFEALERSALDRSRLHIITRGPRWAMFRDGAKRATRVFSDRGEALVQAQQMARRDSSITEIVVHNHLGQVDFRVPAKTAP